MTGDQTLAAPKALYVSPGMLARDQVGRLLDPDAVVPSLDDAEATLGYSCWQDIDRIGVDHETPAPSAESLAQVLDDIKNGALAWRAPEVDL